MVVGDAGDTFIGQELHAGLLAAVEVVVSTVSWKACCLLLELMLVAGGVVCCLG